MGSANQGLVEQMKAIVEPGVELLEIDLRDGVYWWSTRLYLLAAPAQELSDVRAFVFVRGEDRQFVGMAPPALVRCALATQTPELEGTYLDSVRHAPLLDPTSVSSIVYAWTGRLFGPSQMPEGDFASRVSPTTLRAALGGIRRPLNDDSIEWPGYAAPHIVRALVRDFGGEYVALLRQGSLDRVVNRLTLAAEIAARVA